MLHYSLIPKESFKIIGRRRTTPDSESAWRIAREDGSIAQMQAMETGQPLWGLCFGFNENGINDYMVGIEWEEDQNGLESYVYPPSSWLVFKEEGQTDEDLLGTTWEQIYGDFLPRSPYKKRNLPTMESYTAWDAENNFCQIEIWIPVA